MAIKTETIKEFYERTKQVAPPELAGQSTGSHFNVKRRCFTGRMSPYNRRDYYKICLTIGTGRYHSRNVDMPIDGAAIVFSNPSVPSSYEVLDEEQSGFYCLFNDAFLLSSLRQEIKYESPLFNDTLNNIFLLNDQQTEQFSRYFADMEALLTGDYAFKFDMIKSILQTLIHEGIRLQQPVLAKTSSLGERTIARFFSVLDQQFPVDSPQSPLLLKTPSDYAEQLNVHVNHLNNVVKKATGKTTQQILHERIIAEAKVLLVNTAWDAAEIAYSLGFEYPSHFNKYFKQYTLITPLMYRESLMSA